MAQQTSSKSVSVGLLLIGQFLNVGLLFIFTPWLARALSKADYGTYGQVMLVSDLLRNLANTGLATVFSLYLARKQYPDATIFRSFMALYILLGLISMGAILVISPVASIVFNNPHLGYLTALYAFHLPLQMAVNPICHTLIHYRHSKHYLGVSVLGTLIRLLAMLVAVQVYNTVEALIISFYLVPLFQGIYGLATMPRHLLAKGASIEWSILKPAWKQSFPLAITQTLSFCYILIAGQLISWNYGTEVFALFRNGIAELPLISYVYISVGTILLPDMAIMLQQNRIAEFIRLKRDIAAKTAALIYPVIAFLLVFAACFVPLYYGQKYIDSTPIFFIANLILLFKITNYADVLNLTNSASLILRINWQVLLFNLLVSWVLIHYLNIQGGALALLLTNALLYLLLLRKSMQVIKQPLWATIPLRNIIKQALYYVVLALTIRLIAGKAAFSFLGFVASLFVYTLIVYLSAAKLGWLNVRYYYSFFAKIPLGKPLYNWLLKN